VFIWAAADNPARRSFISPFNQSINYPINTRRNNNNKRENALLFSFYVSVLLLM